jgi:AraC family transcriptional regulator
MLPRGTRDKQTWNGESSRLVIAIDGRFLAHSVPETAHLDDVELVPQWLLKDRHIATLMLAMHADLEDGQPAGRLFGEMLGASLANYLVSRFAVRPRSGPKIHGGLTVARLRRVIEYIKSNLEADIALDQIADVANLSAHHFSELFKHSTGQSPHQYVLQCRVDRAKTLLRETELPILEIALLSGFADQSHLTKMFHRTERMTPKEFRLTCGVDIACPMQEGGNRAQNAGCDSWRAMGITVNPGSTFAGPETG